MNNLEKQKILNKIDRNYKCLIKPENPFSLDNPDAFVYKDYTLYAIFIPTFMEKENFDHLLRRLYISQLSCGTKFIPIMLWNKVQNLSDFTSKCLRSSFAHIANDMQDLMDYIEKGEKDFKKWKHLSQLQQKHYVDWQLRMDFPAKDGNDKYIQDDDTIHGSNTINFEVVKDMKSWSDQEKPWYFKKYFRSEYGDLAICNKSSNNSFMPIFQKAMTISFKKMYSFSDGYIEINENVLSKVRVVNTDWELFSKDLLPNKYYRMLSFVGLLPIKMKTKNEIEYWANKYQTMYEYYKKKY